MSDIKEFKLWVTFLNNRGAAGHENYYPAQDTVTHKEPSLDFCARFIAQNGFWRDGYDCFIAPGAITKVEEYEKWKEKR